MIYLKNKVYLIYLLVGWRVNIVLMVMIEVVLALGPPTSPLRYLFLTVTGMMGGSGHIRYQIHHTTYPMESYFSWDYPVVDFVSSSFGVIDGDDTSGVGPRTTHIFSHKADYWIFGGYFVSYWSSNYSSTSRSIKERSSYSLYLKRDDQFIPTGDCRGSFVTRTTHFSSQNFDLSKYRYYGGYFHLSIIA